MAISSQCGETLASHTGLTRHRDVCARKAIEYPVTERKRRAKRWLADSRRNRVGHLSLVVGSNENWELSKPQPDLVIFLHERIKAL